MTRAQGGRWAPMADVSRKRIRSCDESATRQVLITSAAARPVIGESGAVRIVLVHGTTQSPAGWAQLSEELIEDRHDVVAVDLHGLHADASAAAYGQLAADQVGAGSVDVVVAHSGSGLLLSTISTALSARWQVYLAAVVPEGTRSLTDELRARPAEIVHEDWLGVDPTVDLDAARHFLFHDCPPDVQSWALTTLRAFVPLAVYDEAIPPAGVASAAIVPIHDRTLRPSWMVEASRQRLGVEPILVDAGHCPHVSQPRAVADAICNATSR